MQTAQLEEKIKQLTNEGKKYPFFLTTNATAMMTLAKLSDNCPGLNIFCPTSQIDFSLILEIIKLRQGMLNGVNEYCFIIQENEHFQTVYLRLEEKQKPFILLLDSYYEAVAEDYPRVLLYAFPDAELIRGDSIQLDHYSCSIFALHWASLIAKMKIEKKDIVSLFKSRIDSNEITDVYLGRYGEPEKESMVKQYYDLKAEKMPIEFIKLMQERPYKTVELNLIPFSDRTNPKYRNSYIVIEDGSEDDANFYSVDDMGDLHKIDITNVSSFNKELKTILEDVKSKRFAYYDFICFVNKATGKKDFEPIASHTQPNPLYSNYREKAINSNNFVLSKYEDCNKLRGIFSDDYFSDFKNTKSIQKEKKYTDKYLKTFLEKNNSELISFKLNLIFGMALLEGMLFPNEEIITLILSKIDTEIDLKIETDEIVFKIIHSYRTGFAHCRLLDHHLLKELASDKLVSYTYQDEVKYEYDGNQANEYCACEIIELRVSLEKIYEYIAEKINKLYNISSTNRHHSFFFQQLCLNKMLFHFYRLVYGENWEQQFLNSEDNDLEITTAWIESGILENPAFQDQAKIDEEIAIEKATADLKEIFQSCNNNSSMKASNYFNSYKRKFKEEDEEEPKEDFSCGNKKRKI